ncbi:GNAT family N-acetyltransferase [Salininema proteolyticum]|uniref:GNAT family N-acetyltransferase n=1 Tax=Salininema proteolyticum TaxID=1607685 RepID=A0ABV8TWS5_9ACTN
MTVLTRTIGTGEDQLARMRELATRLWSWSSRWHPGELAAFWWERGGPLEEWRISTWQRNDVTVGWAWSKSPGRLDVQVDPAHPELTDLILDWFEDSPVGRPRTVVTVLEAESSLIRAFEERGFAVDPAGPYFAHLRLDLSDLAGEATAVGEFKARPVRGLSDAEKRADLHRAVFGGDRRGGEVNSRAYRSLMGDEQYRRGLDWLVESADGTPAAYCLAWLDPVNAVAALEPVGTDPRYRRRGLARLAMLGALRAARDEGAEYVRVCARGDDGYTAAKALYEDLGFRCYARNVKLVRDAA